VVDCLTPIGKGQSMLIAGQQGTGKTTLATAAVRWQLLEHLNLDAEMSGSVSRAQEGRRRRRPKCVYAILGDSAAESDAGVGAKDGAGVGGRFATLEKGFGAGTVHHSYTL
jgi:hypothetical protein